MLISQLRQESQLHLAQHLQPVGPQLQVLNQCRRLRTTDLHLQIDLSRTTICSVADQNPQNLVQVWISETWLSGKLGVPHTRLRVKLTSGGSYTFPAVSAEQSSVATIHTGSAHGKNAPSKIYKVRSDLYFLLLAKAQNKTAVFTDRAMFNYFRDEKEEGRLPKEVQLLWVDKLPDEIAAILESTQAPSISR